MKLKIIVFLICVLFLSNLVGCEAFVRKFTRKPKKQETEEELVLTPEEYKGPQMTKEELYRKYLLYWKSWLDELITALLQNTSHKRQVDCVSEAIENLVALRTLLNENKQKQLNKYINQMNELKDAIIKDVYGSNSNANRQESERIRMNILRYFSYDKISKDISYGGSY
jgi:hypothetical protein